MPQTLDNGAVVPINSDAYRLTADLAAMGVSLSVITNVNSQAQRDALTKFTGRTVRRLDRAGLPMEVWNGTAWKDDPGSLGRLAQSVQPASFDGFSAGEFFADAIASVALKGGRKYRIDYRFALVAPTGASIGAVFNFKKSATTDTGVTGSQIESPIVWSPPVANSGGSYNLTTTYNPSADETVRLLVTSGRVAGSSLYNLSSRTLTVTDEGAQF